MTAVKECNGVACTHAEVGNREFQHLEKRLLETFSLQSLLSLFRPWSLTAKGDQEALASVKVCGQHHGVSCVHARHNVPLASFSD